MIEIIFSIIILLFIAAVLFCGIFFFFLWLRNDDSSLSGHIGEMKVSFFLSFLPSKYIVLNDILLQNGNKSSQIDHIVVSRYGVFVIETKNYSGWIYGSEKSRQWTQNIYGEKHSFFNPVLQNKGHIHTLKTVLGLPKEFFISIVAFSEKADLKSSFNENVVYISEINGLIKSYDIPVLSDEDVEYITAILNDRNVTSAERREQHTENIRQHLQEQEDMIENGRCPICGGRLVIRNGRYGEFIGCSNYPNCRFTQNLK